MKHNKKQTYALTVVSIALAIFVTSCSNDEDLYRIQKDGLYGFIDKSGKAIIEPQYEYVSGFTKDGYAMIILDASISQIEYPSPVFRSIVQSDTVLKVTYNYIDKRGNLVLPSNEVIFLRNSEPWLLYNRPQEFVDKFNSHTLDFREYILPELDMENNQYLFQNDNYLVGYKDRKGNTVVKPSFFYGRSMSAGMTFVIDSLKPMNEDKGIDDNIIKYMNENLNRTHLIDANGNDITEMRMHDFRNFNNWGHAWVSVSTIDTDFTQDCDWFRIDRSGRITCGPVSSGIGGSVYNNYLSEEPLYLVEYSFGILGPYYTWVDETGKYITDFDKDGTVKLSFDTDSQSELFCDVTNFSNGVAGVKRFNGDGEPAWLFINRSFDVISDPYDSICPFKNGFAAVQEKHPKWRHMGKWGFVGLDWDSTITQKIPFNFTKVSSFNKDGLAYASIQGSGYIKEGYINTDGEFIWETLRKRR